MSKYIPAKFVYREQIKQETRALRKQISMQKKFYELRDKARSLAVNTGKITAEEFDKLFDEGGDISPYLEAVREEEDAKV